MEDVLDLYHEDYDPERPVVCFDETSKQLIEDVRPPIKAKPGRVERYDTDQRNGTRNLFMFCEPKGGSDMAEVTGRRTAMRTLLTRCAGWLTKAYAHARVVRLVLDNLNTHKLGSLYEAFGASEAPSDSQALGAAPHSRAGSWLNMAEIELSVFSRQCLNPAGRR